MRLLLSCLFFIGMLPMASIAQQDSNHVNWKVISKNAGTGVIEVKLTGYIQKGWHIYKADAAEEIKGVQVTVTDSSLKLSSPVIHSTAKMLEDPIFDKKNLEIYTDSIELIQQIHFTGGSTPSLRLQLNYEVAEIGNLLTEEQKLTVAGDNKAGQQISNRILVSSIDLNHPVNDCGTSSSVRSGSKKSGLLNLFFLGFLGGLVALLTPCVFPMIPLTVSFFTKKAGSKKAGVGNAFLYGFFIFLIYILLSLPFHFLDKLNPEILNNISTNVYLNVIFFAVFMFFAFSFFGFYEITLPSGLSSKADSKAGVGNIIGIFFMAVTLALVSFSCTGPILGSLLAGSLSADGGAMQLTSGMAGFGLALALPFGLFALFPNLLSSLPKSGGWLNTVKVVLGFLEVALAFKFFSNADLVMHWNILKREIFIAIWIITGIGLTLYLFGLIKFPHDGPTGKLSKFRIFLALLVAAFTAYLVPGLTNTKAANLSLISGFPPPLYYSVYQKSSDCVLGLNCSKDYDQGLAMARSENKPVLLDFTGYACVNCRRMEENVWSDPEVFKLMQEHFIVISLYVDDKKILPAANQFTYITKNGTKKEINSVGDKWATFETENFENNSQPLYAIINTNEQLLTHPVGYTPSVKEYLAWLQCGLSAFSKK